MTEAPNNTITEDPKPVRTRLVARCRKYTGEPDSQSDPDSEFFTEDVADLITATRLKRLRPGQCAVLDWVEVPLGSEESLAAKNNTEVLALRVNDE